MPDKETVVHILWINAGLSCDGDSVALTAAMQSSIEDIVFGTLPGLPKVDVHWPLIAPETGPVGSNDDFIEWFFKGARGEINPFVLVIEGSIPNEKIKKEGYWSGFGNDPASGQPITTSEWIDRLAPKALLVLADVEALLVYGDRNGGFECFIVPIDACYALTGTMRRRWKGFDGGEQAWNDVDAFFDKIRERSQTAPFRG